MFDFFSFQIYLSFGKRSIYHIYTEFISKNHFTPNKNKSQGSNIRIHWYVIWNMLKSADLHETILTPVICHKHVRRHDGVTLYFSMKKFGNWLWWNSCSVCSTAGILSSSKSSLCDDFRARRTNVKPCKTQSTEATGFYMYYCRWQVAISALRFSVFTSVQSMFSFSFFFWFFFTSESGNVLTYIKIIHLSSSLERPMETSRGNTASRHRDNVHVYDKWLVWG